MGQGDAGPWRAALSGEREPHGEIAAVVLGSRFSQRQPFTPAGVWSRQGTETGQRFQESCQHNWTSCMCRCATTRLVRHTHTHSPVAGSCCRVGEQTLTIITTRPRHNTTQHSPQAPDGNTDYSRRQHEAMHSVTVRCVQEPSFPWSS